MKEEIACLAGDKLYISSVEDDLVPFLEVFFSSRVVDIIKDNLHLLSKSFLGPSYSLRVGRVSLARRIVDDLFWEYVCQKKEEPLAGFMGQAFDADEVVTGDEVCPGQYEGAFDVNEIVPGDEVCPGQDGGTFDANEVVTRDEVCPHGESFVARDDDVTCHAIFVGNDFIPHQAFDGDDVAGHDGGKGGWQEGHGHEQGSGQGGGRRDGKKLPSILVNVDSESHSGNAEVVQVLLSAFKTPPKPSKLRWDAQAQAQMLQHKLSIGERSILFIDHASVVEGAPYDPSVQSDGNVHLYHGSRVLSFPRFQAHGIDPIYANNEFHATTAFYLSNSIQHAFEHPLHYHPAGSVENPVAVLVFDVDLQVLHGEEAPPGESRPFDVFKEPDHC